MKTSVLIPFVSLATLPAMLMAQPAAGSLAVELSAFTSSDMDVPGVGAEYEGSTTSLDLDYNLPLNETTVLLFDAGWTQTNLDWSGEGFDFGLGTIGVPFDEGQSVELGLGVRHRLNERWGIMANLSWEQAEGEGGTFAGSSPDAEDLIGGTLVVSYAQSRELIWFFGFFAEEELEDDPQIIPFVGVRWQFDPQWVLETRNGVVLRYLHDETLTVETSVLFNNTSLPIGEVQGDLLAVNADGFEAEVAVEWQATDNIALRPFIGYRFSQEWEFRWRDREIASVDADGAFTYGFGVTAKW